MFEQCSAKMLFQSSDCPLSMKLYGVLCLAVVLSETGEAAKEADSSIMLLWSPPGWLFPPEYQIVPSLQTKTVQVSSNSVNHLIYCLVNAGSCLFPLQDRNRSIRMSGHRKRRQMFAHRRITEEVLHIESGRCQKMKDRREREQRDRGLAGSMAILDKHTHTLAHIAEISCVSTAGRIWIDSRCDVTP